MQVEVVDREVRHRRRDQRAARFEEPPEHEPESHAERWPEPEAPVLRRVREAEHDRRRHEAEAWLKKASKEQLLGQGARAGLREDVSWPQEAADDLSEGVGHATHCGRPARGPLAHGNDRQSESDAERDVEGGGVERPWAQERPERVAEERRHGERDAAQCGVSEDDHLACGAHHGRHDSSAD